MVYYCPECGEEMIREEDGDLYCDNCMCYFSYNKNYTDPNRYLWITDADEAITDTGPGCKACGNLSYPKCIDSCRLMNS